MGSNLPNLPIGQALVTIESASVRFGQVEALRELSLTLRRGDRLALVGANGSGKTTLLRLLHGLVEPTEGRCTHHLLQPEARAATCAMLFQRPFLLRLSALRNVSLGLWLRGWPRAERAQASLRALQRVGLGPLARRPAHELSGGQQQRLALARAWAQRPDILFLDEPTASLDPSAKREVEMLIDAFAAEGMTVVLATHNLGQAKRLASRVAYLEGGRLVVERPVHEFFTEALPTQAALFLKGEMAWA
ncbi:MAG TPA: ATP-binding cassette domain-containing protein [Ideonella sp.]|jgi:tungstate transport system ATP-binding protein|nr:ATP-binding cassette domain-containing protein [Ideonella sp.]